MLSKKVIESVSYMYIHVDRSPELGEQPVHNLSSLAQLPPS